MRADKRRLAAVALATVLVGCATEKKTDASSIESDASTEASVSTDDSCQKYMAADIESKRTYLFAGCVYLGVMTRLAEASAQTSLPEPPKCGSPEAPQGPVGLAITMEAICSLDRSAPVRDAVYHYWMESLKKGTFN
jgi:hypothetical protein